MADWPPRTAPEKPVVGLAERLSRRWLIVVAGAAVLLVLSVAGRLAPLDALIALAVLVLAALLSGRVAAGAAPAPVRGLESGREPALRNFADALTEPCILVDGRSVVLHANRPATEEFPTLRSGQPISLALRHPGLLSAIEGAGESRAVRSVELQQTVPAQSWHKVTVSPLGGAGTSGADDLLVVTMRSLTEERRVNQLRSDFIANVSHELRTPLTSLVGFIDTLLGPAANDAAAREKFLGIMRAQATRMSKLIDDLLSLSRIEMRQHVRPTGRVDLAPLLREVREGLQSQASAAGVEVVLSVPEGPAVVTGERDELYEVFENLIDNAIKYGADGKTIEVSLAPAEPPQTGYRVSVTDHGVGVEEEHVPRLTERFYRVDAESSRRKKGTGLGLAIVKHIVQRHRGQLTIRSRPGEGTRVGVHLPS